MKNRMKELKLSDSMKNITMKKAFDIISSVESYPEFVPGYKKVELLEKREDYIKADIMPTVPVKNIIMEAFLEFPNKIEFRQLDGPLDIFEGVWRLSNEEDENVVKVDFYLKYYVKNFILRQLVYKFIKMSFKDIITSFKIRGRQI